MCLDALIQLVAIRPLDQSLPKSPLSQSLSSTAFLPLQVSVHSEDVLFAVLEATRLVKPANKSDVLRVEHVWAGVAHLLSQVRK